MKLLIINGRDANAVERRMADAVVANGKIVKNKWGGLKLGELRLTDEQREKVANALGQS